MSLKQALLVSILWCLLPQVLSSQSAYPTHQPIGNEQEVLSQLNQGPDQTLAHADHVLQAFEQNQAIQQQGLQQAVDKALLQAQASQQSTGVGDMGGGEPLCNPGQEHTESGCTDCTPGTYSTNGTECSPCADGLWSDASAVTCFDCVAVLHCADAIVTCDAVSGVASCVACEDGFTGANCDAQPPPMLVCDPGQGVSNGACVACDVGFFSGGGSNVVCQACSAPLDHCVDQPPICDFITGVTTTCVICDAGFVPPDCHVADEPAQASTGGTVVGITGNTGSQPGGGMEQASTGGGASQPVECEAGLEVSGGMCQPCAAGSFSTGGPNAQCQLCTPIEHCEDFQPQCDATTGAVSACAQCGEGFDVPLCTASSTPVVSTGVGGQPQATGATGNQNPGGGEAATGATGGGMENPPTCDAGSGVVGQTCLPCDAGSWSAGGAGVVCEACISRDHCTDFVPNCDPTSGQALDCTACADGFTAPDCSPVQQPEASTGSGPVQASTGGGGEAATANPGPGSSCEAGNEWKGTECGPCALGSWSAGGTEPCQACTQNNCVSVSECNPTTGETSQCSSCEAGWSGAVCDQVESAPSASTGQSNPSPPEPTGSNPSPPEGTGSNPSPPEPTGSNPSPPEGTGSNPSPPEPTGSNPSPPEGTGSNPSPPEPTGSNPSPPEGTGTNEPPPEGTGSNPSPPEPTGSNPSPPEPTGSNPSTPESTGSNPSPPEPTGTNEPPPVESTGAGQPPSDTGANNTPPDNTGAQSSGPAPPKRFVPGIIDVDPFASGTVFTSDDPDQKAERERKWPAPFDDESDEVNAAATTQPTGGYYTPEIEPESTTTASAQPSTTAVPWKKADVLTSSGALTGTTDINWRLRQLKDKIARGGRKPNHAQHLLSPSSETESPSFLESRVDVNDFSRNALKEDRSILDSELKRIDQKEPKWLRHSR